MFGRNVQARDRTVGKISTWEKQPVLVKACLSEVKRVTKGVTQGIPTVKMDEDTKRSQREGWDDCRDLEDAREGKSSRGRKWFPILNPPGRSG